MTEGMTRNGAPADDDSPADGNPPPAVTVDAGTADVATDNDSAADTADLSDALGGVHVEGDLHVHFHADGDDGVEAGTDTAECDCAGDTGGHGTVTGPLDRLATAVSWCGDAAHDHVRPFTLAVFLLSGLALLAMSFPLATVLNVATLVSLVLNFVVMLAKTNPGDGG